MENLSQLVDDELIEKLQSLIDKNSVVIIEYKDVFREVFLKEIIGDKLWVYQKSDLNAAKNQGLRQMFLEQVILWEVLKDKVVLEDWKVELQEIEERNKYFLVN